MVSSEKLKIASNVAIGTTTFYKSSNELRAKLAERTIKNIVNRGYKMVVVDGSPNDEFRKVLEGSGAQVYVETQRGMGGSRREVLQYAHDLNTPVVAWTEPEKEGYASQIIKTVAPILNGDIDMVVPDRRIITDSHFHLPTYPTSQVNEELFGDDCWRELTGTNLDVWSGPRTWRRDISKYFLDYDGNKLSYKDKNGEDISYGDKWDSIFIPIMQAILDGRKVKGISVNYIHPIEQTRLEEGNWAYTQKRLDQLNNLVPAFTDYWNKNYPGSELEKIREQA